MKRRDSFSATRQGTNRKGFTLIEILVVLAIAAIVSSITLGGFNEMRAGNKRVSCSTNLSQLYQAARLYAADEGGKFPFYGNVDTSTTPPTVAEYSCATPANNTGIGLWSLYTFPQGSAALDAGTIAAVDSKPIERYIRSSKVLHCPADQGETGGYSNENFHNADRTAYNPAYLSYQTCDALSGNVPTYSSVRLNDQTTATPSALWERQLLHFTDRDADSIPDFVRRQPTGDTVVTYCLHHREERADDNVYRGEREMDNVLFYDGSIQLLPREQNGGITDWKREPKSPN